MSKNIRSESSQRVRIYLVSRPSLNITGLQSFLSDEKTEWRRTHRATQAEELVEVSGRVCYMSFGEAQSPRDTNAYIDNLIAMGHESVLEHASWTLLISGVTRAFTHQLVRHRAGFSFSQLSQQYHDETTAEFIPPGHLAQYPAARRAWENAVNNARTAYAEILETLNAMEADQAHSIQKREVRRAIRSAARSVLPNATATKIMVTANARSWRYFLKTRGTIPGDLEMRNVAARVLEILRPEAPALFSDFEVSELTDGPIIVHTAHSVKGRSAT
ncbi:MAG: thymidylate synthase (FAD) [Verrucomicrobia bacterium]|nr:MAG: thymidylate synthase (FAD) [Verrucomicrobiota bacterium]